MKFTLNDMRLATETATQLREAISTCEATQDYVSRDLLAKLLEEEESDFQTRDILGKLLEDTDVDHTWWLEKQLGLIEKVGLENYLQSQM